ncbi:MAG: DNA repair protein RadA [Gammaproteobacteria bacterium]|nr:DNA repair protein RadA [Gammaproteobacteria bacterium]
MSKQKIIYSCTECGAEANKWSGQCFDCGGWNTLVEAISEPKKTGRHANFSEKAMALKTWSMTEVETGEKVRSSIGISELDRVLGGGLVQGSVILIGGDPGIGKSTLLLQGMVNLCKQTSALYVTGEESLQQVTMRAQRMGLVAPELRLVAETSVERILEIAASESPQVMVIDSIQTVYTDELSSAPGSVSQVRECAARLVNYAKQTGTAMFLVGHVTKEGALAGPRVLEHMVDTVLYFEGDSSSSYRVIRANKNRFGAVNELGVFAMTEKGLREVKNPSAIFLSRHEEPVSGSVIMVTREGSRPMLVEVQVLVDESHSPNSRRVTLGLDQNRLSMLLAVLHRHGGIAMFDQDVFVNVVGGVRVTETAIDLAVLLAALSSMRNKPMPNDLVVFGEVGLSGEVRPVQAGQERLHEAAKHGFKKAIVPAANAPKKKIEGMEVIAVNRISEALEAI